MLNIDPDTPKLSESKYAVRRKELLALVKQLRAIGAQTELDLPRIAVIGNQSAGKSSVVEAISGITVPRDAGTCTRCPMECRMSSSGGPWSCHISIRWEYDESGNQLKDVSEVPFGDMITDKGAVEIALRRAQAAVLHPSTPATQFQGLRAEELERFKGKPLQFSRNVVCIDLEGPDLTDLSFIDLPGIIQNAEKEVVNLVEELVISHIKGNTIILVALPMTDDIENQKALRLAHQEDPDGHRTIGVLTKPDMLGSGSTKARELWVDVIEGRRHRLTHGYYCTRQPDDAERAEGITSTQARASEATFFRTTTPWSNFLQSNRFGTTNLVNALSVQLVQMINDMLPNFRNEAAMLLDGCHNSLSTVPKAVNADPASYMMGLIAEFCKTVDQYVGGGAETGDLIQEHRVAYAAFKRAIRSTAPNFKPYLSSNRKGYGIPDSEWSGDEDEDDEDNDEDEDEDEGEDSDSDSEDEPVGLAKPFYLKDMRDHINKSITRELPNNMPFQSKVALIIAFQDTWKVAARTCAEEVRQSMLNFLHASIKQTFSRYENLQNHLRILIPDLVTRHSERCLERITEQLEIERTPYTQNTHYLETSKEKWMAKYKDMREKRRDSKAAFITEPSPGQYLYRDPTPYSSISILTRFKPHLPSDAPVEPTQKPAELFWKKKLEASQVTPATPTPAWKTRLSKRQPRARKNPPAQGELAFDAKAFAPRTSPAADTINDVLAGLARLGFTGVTQEDLAKLLPSDEYESEIRVMAEVRGYFQVSYKRVIDNIPGILDLLLVKAVSKDLQSFLITQLEIGSASATERLAMYVAEDPRVVAYREELVARKKRLESVERELRNFGL
ncbi:hypothetical protein BV22DRAFT_826286 [Leucogyrophana mollusca]|uniref:Uncharacterized protein n=1 Tax=Leucogyrophana mollusca TaxID=85980 RepID=A0ACB8B3H5_9AGAM|nr:hypothetical protein BV22DRAFT_826286 [Leucogyrophana mollusca]